MADDTFNGASLTFATVSAGSIRSINTNQVGAKADVTGSGDSEKSYGVGIPDLTVTVEIVGGTDIAVGDKGTVAIDWGDIGGSTLGSLTDGQVVSVATTGSMDGEILTTIEFCQAAPTS